MKELKFRIWDKTEKEFTNVLPSFVYNSQEKVFEFCGSLYQRENWVIQQFTGCKDENGKEIYEGDIIKATSEEFINENFVAEVRFDEGDYYTYINSRDIRGIWSGDDIEVIGNIFENPELLKNE